MTTPHELDFAEPIGPNPRPSDDELAGMATVRIPRQRPPQARRGAPLIGAALVNTLLAAVISVCAVMAVVFLAVVATGKPITAITAQVALGGYLLAHGVPLTTSIGQIGLAPLSVALLVVWRLNRAGVHTTRGIGARATGSIRHALLVAVTIGSGYALIGLLTTLVVSAPGMTAQPWRALLHFFVLGTLAALIGSIRTTGALTRIARATPLLFRDGIRTGVVATFLLLAAGAGVTGVAVALRGGEATDIIGAYPTGIAGQAGLTLVCLAFAPDFAVWAAAYLLGPGFSFGTGTLVSAAEVKVGAVPALPIFAGIPEGPLHGPGWAVIVLPLLAPLVASVLMVRRRLRPRRTRLGDIIIPRPHWPRMIGSSIVAGLVAGLLMTVASVVATGPLGGGRLAQIGPLLWPTTLVAMGVVTLGALLGLSSVFIYNRR